MTKGFEQYGYGLYLPTGSVKKEVRRSFQETPLEMKKKVKTKDISKIMLHCMRMEISRLTDTYLDGTGDMQNVLKLERALEKLGEDYGVTFVIAVSGDDIIIDTEEILNEVAGDLSEYNLVSSMLHDGVKVLDDISALTGEQKVSDSEAKKLDIE